jgi:purine-binding chemotaxis protein CheW
MSIVDTNVDDQDNVAKGDGDQLQLVTFEVADEEFAVNILAVQEINRMMEITRVPQSPA